MTYIRICYAIWYCLLLLNFWISLSSELFEFYVVKKYARYLFLKLKGRSLVYMFSVQKDHCLNSPLVRLKTTRYWKRGENFEIAFVCLENEDEYSKLKYDSLYRQDFESLNPKPQNAAELKAASVSWRRWY